MGIMVSYYSKCTILDVEKEIYNITENCLQIVSNTPHPHRGGSNKTVGKKRHDG